MKAPWIPKKYFDDANQGKWKIFFDKDLQKYGGALVLTSNLNRTYSLKVLKIDNCFIRGVLTIWTEVNFESQIKSEIPFVEQSICYNSMIRIDDRPIFHPDWFQKEVTKG